MLPMKWRLQIPPQYVTFKAWILGQSVLCYIPEYSVASNSSTTRESNLLPVDSPPFLYSGYLNYELFLSFCESELWIWIEERESRTLVFLAHITHLHTLPLTHSLFYRNCVLWFSLLMYYWTAPFIYYWSVRVCIAHQNHENSELLCPALVTLSVYLPFILTFHHAF